MPRLSATLLGLAALILTAVSAPAQAPKEKKKKPPAVELKFPPQLPEGKEVVTDSDAALITPPANLRKDVAVAKTPPVIEFRYFPGQDYKGNPWSNWGDSTMAWGKYYATIGDHLSPGGNSFVYEYDPAAKTLKQIADVRKVLNLPDGHYTPGKIHGRIDPGSDGWLYYSTTRGGNATTDQYHYKGDWILRTHPGTGKTEIVVCGPIPKHNLPGSRLDPERMIFYGSTREGSSNPASNPKPNEILFYAYDLKAKKLLYSAPKKHKEWVMQAPSTGRAYFVHENGDLMRYDPAVGSAVRIAGEVQISGAATTETPQGFIYTVGEGNENTSLWSFNTKTEELKDLGSVVVGTRAAISALNVDPTGKYVYYTVGMHGTGWQDGSPVVQFDVTTGKKKVLAFLHPYYQQKYGCTPVGSYSAALDEKGETLYITWNVKRGTVAWDCCAMTAIHIPTSERP